MIFNGDSFIEKVFLQDIFNSLNELSKQQLQYTSWTAFLFFQMPTVDWSQPDDPSMNITANPGPEIGLT